MPELQVGSETEIAKILLGEDDLFGPGPATLAGVIYDEGAIWQAAPSGVWKVVTDTKIACEVMNFDGKPKPDGKPLKTGASFCSGTRQQIAARTATPNFFADGAWGVAFRDKFLRIDRDGSAELEPLTPEHRARFALDFEYDAQTPVPEHFCAFLQSLFGEPEGFDDEGMLRVNQLLEWIGYLLSGRTDFQKIGLLIGPPRSGKGTLLRILQRIFGDAAVPFKVASLGERFQVGALSGKTLGYDADVRRSSISDGSESKSVEMLLSISGEDAISIEAKYQSVFGTSKLGARLMLCTNPPFKMTDVGAALSTRLLIMSLDRSFLGKEDLQLESKLVAEIPGIVQMALHALQDLSKRGHFVEPKAAEEPRKSIEISETPLLGFLEERCEMGRVTDPKFEIGCGALYQELTKWCQDTGHRKPSDSTFAETLKRLGILKTRKSDQEGRRRVYCGIRLLPAEAAHGTPKFRLASVG